METRLPGHYEWRLGAKTGRSPTARRTGQVDPSETFNVFEANPEKRPLPGTLLRQHCAQKAALYCFEVGASGAAAAWNCPKGQRDEHETTRLFDILGLKYVASGVGKSSMPDSVEGKGKSGPPVYGDACAAVTAILVEFGAREHRWYFDLTSTTPPIPSTGHPQQLLSWLRHAAFRSIPIVFGHWMQRSTTHRTEFRARQSDGSCRLGLTRTGPSSTGELVRRH